MILYSVPFGSSSSSPTPRALPIMWWTCTCTSTSEGHDPPGPPLPPPSSSSSPSLLRSADLVPTDRSSIRRPTVRPSPSSSPSFPPRRPCARSVANASQTFSVNRSCPRLNPSFTFSLLARTRSLVRAPFFRTAARVHPRPRLPPPLLAPPPPPPPPSSFSAAAGSIITERCNFTLLRNASECSGALDTSSPTSREKTFNPSTTLLLPSGRDAIGDER
mmetsp:Transcript_55120/g.165115  ORF Transcript_55120/g.165115 Transcript_55120/m.165115 type:complete len:218 (+) Transcript_55120:196-849(+)